MDSSLELLARIDRERMLHEIAHNDFGLRALKLGNACDSGESCDDEDQPDV